MTTLLSIMVGTVATIALVLMIVLIVQVYRNEPSKKE